MKTFLKNVIFAIICIVINASCASEVLRTSNANAQGKEYSYLVYSQLGDEESQGRLIMRFSKDDKLAFESVNGDAISFTYEEDGTAASASPSGAGYLLNAKGLPVFADKKSISYGYDSDGRLLSVKIAGYETTAILEFVYGDFGGALPRAIGNLILPSAMPLAGLDRTAAGLMANYRLQDLPAEAVVSAATSEGIEKYSLSYKMGADATLYVSIYKTDLDAGGRIEARHLIGLKTYTRQ